VLKPEIMWQRNLAKNMNINLSFMWKESSCQPILWCWCYFSLSWFTFILSWV